MRWAVTFLFFRIDLSSEGRAVVLEDHAAELVTDVLRVDRAEVLTVHEVAEVARDLSWAKILEGLLGLGSREHLRGLDPLFDGVVDPPLPVLGHLNGVTRLIAVAAELVHNDLLS